MQLGKYEESACLKTGRGFKSNKDEGLQTRALSP